MVQNESLHELAVRLCEGGHVWFEGHWFKAVEVPLGFESCNECELDCVCHGSIAELCAECEAYSGKTYLLKFVYRK